MTFTQFVQVSCFLLKGLSNEVYQDQVLCILYEAAQKEGVEFSTVAALAWHESRLRKDARSTEGAIGVLQVLTVHERREGCAGLSQWRNGIGCGVRLLRTFTVACGGKDAEALGAYNTGRCQSTRWSRLVAKTARELR